MAVAVASAKDADGKPHFNVVGVDLDHPTGQARIDAINAGRLPVACTDVALAEALADCHRAGNLIATADPRAYRLASVIVIDVPFDVAEIHDQPRLEWDGFRNAIRTIGRHVSPGALLLVETTVPPGTCQRVIAPDIAACLGERGLPEDAVLLAHSYERVMPGPDYLASIVNFWRVYAGHTPEAADAAEAFLCKVINTRDYPLTRLGSPTASETAKALENSYRAVTIAFAEEWGRFAEAVGIDLFEVIDAIRVRPTHNNMRQPGFGVGGYCLTKDPLMAKLAAHELFQLEGMDFPFSTQAVNTNRVMPLVSLEYMDRALGGLAGRRLLLMGVSYRSDVGDSRYSPSETFVREARKRGAIVQCHDPLISYWRELELDLPDVLPAPAGSDAVIFAVSHEDYRQMDMSAWLSGATPLIMDGNNVLTEAQRSAARAAGCTVLSIGRGTS
jgi:nucleotide sugar dehydrogenase